MHLHKLLAIHRTQDTQHFDQGIVTATLVGARIRALRTKNQLSQDDLARLLGFKDRQTISAIETGVRRVKAEELVQVAEKLGAPLDYFTDPFRLVAEGRFSWRHEGADTHQLEEYERRAGRWIAAFRNLAPRVERRTPLLRRTLGLTRRSSYETAMEAGERFAADFELGSVPATRLARVMERDLGILVLMVDARRGISGAACRLPELDVVLIARHEVVGRRSFDLAHELFHLLTWDTMPPEHLEEALETGGRRVEQLANNFAGAVLMPTTALDRFGDLRHLSEQELVARLIAAGDELHVTASALMWRLVALRRLTKSAALALPPERLRNNGREFAGDVAPALFSKPFAEVASLAVDRGHVSMRRMAGVLDLPVEGVMELFAAHGVPAPVEL